jgi:hypothetical protein
MDGDAPPVGSTVTVEVIIEVGVAKLTIGVGVSGAVAVADLPHNR